MANSVAQNRVADFKKLINQQSTISMLKASCGDLDTAKKFASSMLDLYGEGGDYLQKCDSQAIINECLKAAQLNLPIIKSLGYAYIVPYKNTPTLTIGWRGLVQLAQNTGKYKYINADAVYEGESVTFDRLSGSIQITGDPTSDKAIGYFAYIKLLNGFEKTIYMTREQVEAYGKKYSPSYNKGPWQTDFDAMAKKTVLKKVLKYGPSSTQMMQVESDEIHTAQAVAENEVSENANKGDVIDITEDSVSEENVEPDMPKPTF